MTHSTPVIAKLDRLGRNAAFLLTLRDAGVKFVAADNPDVNELTAGILIVVAEDEAKRISTRTVEALAAAKARGTRLGNPNGAAPLLRAGKGNAAAVDAIKEKADRHASDLAPVVAHLQATGFTSLPALAKALNDQQFTTPRGGRWHPSSVRNLLAHPPATSGKRPRQSSTERLGFTEADIAAAD